MNARYFDATYLAKLSWPERGGLEVAACAAGANEIVSAIHGRAEFVTVGLRKSVRGSPLATKCTWFTRSFAPLSRGASRALQNGGRLRRELGFKLAREPSIYSLCTSTQK